MKADHLLLDCYREAKRLEENQGSLFDAELEQQIINYLTYCGLWGTEQ